MGFGVSLGQHSRCGHLADAARIVATIDTIVALFSPARSPRVLHNPIGQRLVEVGIIWDAIADNQDAMIEILFIAQWSPGMRDAATIELHGVGVEAC